MLRIAAVGDIMPGEVPLTFGFGVRSVLDKGVDLFRNVQGILGEKDICFGNLECVLSESGYDEANIQTMHLRGSKKFVECLKKANFTALSIANNHIMQHGTEAFSETVELLRNSNIEAVGISRLQEQKCVPVIIQKNGLNICFLGFSKRPEKYSRTVYYANATTEVIVDQTKECSSIYDIVIVSLHWGDEFIGRPSFSQVNEAHSIIDAGASLILGHHPHILQGIESYKNGLIAYSLGNFIFDFWQEKLRESMILCIDFEGKSIKEYNSIPICIGPQYTPQVLVGRESEALKRKIGHLKIWSSNSQYSSKMYQLEVGFREILNRLQNRIFFLRNLCRYSLGYTFKMFKLFIYSRVKNINLE